MDRFEKNSDAKHDGLTDDNNINSSIGEVNNDTTAFENRQKGNEADEKGTQGKGGNNEVQEKADAQKAEAFGKEKADNSEKDSNTSVEAEYSSCYKPPYYTLSCEGEHCAKDKKRSYVGLIAVAAALVIVLTVLFIYTGGSLLDIFTNHALSTPKTDLSDGSMNIIQNSPQINIAQNNDEDYIPQSLPEVVSKVGNSVVEISTSSTKVDYFYGQYVTSGAGSGVIITQSEEAGYIITNHHVIYDDSGRLADSVKVILTNGEEYEATLLGSDQSIDLALLAIKKKEDETFTVASFGKSSNLVVGQDVIAIGNPLGSLGGTVTDGIISALDRRVKIDGVEMVLLQHNAAINPGNSGGALFDMMGNLVGIVNAKTSDTGIEGLGFAIPSDIALNFVNRIMVVERAIGIKVQYGKLNNVTGLYVVETTNSDFKKYDRIIKVNGTDINNAAEYYAIVDCLKEGDSADITVRRGNAEYKITVTREK